MSVSTRTPKVYIRFIGETDSFVSPEHVLSVRTAKTLSANPGTFEVTFKTGDLKTSSYFNPARPAKTGVQDPWMALLPPMTVAIIVMGDARTVGTVQGFLESRDRTASLPDAYAAASQQIRTAIDDSVVMVGLVEDSTLSVMMSSEGPQRVLRVSGKDFTKVLLDDSLRRIARSTRDNGPDNRQIITFGDVSAEDRDALLKRSSISVGGDSFWANIVAEGSDSKETLKNVLTGIMNNAPSLRVKLVDGQPISKYFAAEPVVGAELSSRTVRPTLALFTYNGPVWGALQQLAPQPLAEMFVETIGLRNVLIVRRPPFFRPSVMGSMAETMRAFMRKSQRPPAEITAVMNSLTPELQNDHLRALPSTVVDQQDVIGLNLNRSAAAVFSQYQVIPFILMNGQFGEYAAMQGVTASYLYDVSAAIRFGSRILQAVCPWDYGMPRRVLRETGPSSRTFSTTETAEARARRVQEESSRAVSGEQTLSASEAVRLYYYMRDNSALLNGSLSMRANPKVRVGQTIQLPWFENKIGYVESVQHSYQFGQAFVTQVGLSRVQPLDPIPGQRLVTYDIEHPIINGERP